MASSDNDCIHMIGRYPQGTFIPAANGDGQVVVGNLQICAINVKGEYQYPCPFTKYGAEHNCKDYRNKTLPNNACRLAPTVAQDGTGEAGASQ